MYEQWLGLTNYVNIYKPIVFILAGKNWNEIKNSIHKGIKKHKILRNKFNMKHASLYPYTENYKTLLRDLNKWRNIPSSWLGKLNIRLFSQNWSIPSQQALFLVDI